MGRPFSLKPKVPSGTSLRLFAFFGALFIVLNLLFPTQSVSAFNEQYRWDDKNTVVGSGGNLGNSGHAFSKSGGMYYGGSGVAEMYIYDELVITPDNCGVLLGIQVGSNTGTGTLRRVMDPVLDSASNACPKDYNLSKAFSTNLRLANSEKSDSNPSQKVTIVVRALVSKDEEYPGTTDTFTIKDEAGKVLVKRGVDKNNAYSKGDWKGFERKFTLNTSIGSDKRYEACSAALNICAPMAGSSLITAPLGIYEIEIKKDPVDTTAVCSAGALGWVFCPLSEFLQDTITGIAGFLEKMLTYDPLLSSEQGKAIRAIWGVVLVIANVGLIVAFLAVVFSQATSVGISSYGVKKLLPRIIAAAVLMNLSFYICAVAVDIANIAGVSIKGIVDAGMQVVAGNKTGDAQSGAEWYQQVTVAVMAAGGVALVIGTTAYALLLPMAISAVLAVLTAFLVLAAREVIITLLIILAPLAFLAWVLPNTDEWFTRWRKLFTAMLVMFPLVMAIFYGSVLVSSLVMATRQNGTGAQGNMEDLMVNLLALGILVIPLFSLPFIMKSAGGVLDRLGIMVNNKNKGLVDRSRKKGQELYNRGSYARGRAIRNQAKVELRNKRFASRLSAAEGARTREEALANRAKALGYVDANGNGDISQLSAGEVASTSAQWARARNTRRLAGGAAGMRADLVDRANRRKLDAQGNDVGAAAPLTAAILGNSQDQRLVASQGVRAQTGALVRAAQAQEAKEFNERVSTILTSYERGGEAGADTKAGGYLEQQWRQAIATNNQEQAAAVITRLSNLGGGGRDRVAKLVERTRVTDQGMRDAITKSVAQDNYGSLVGKRGDLAKGHYDAAGNWSPAGNIAKVSSEQLATQDKQALKLHFADIPQAEAARIVSDTELRSKVTGAEELAILEAAAQGLPNPYPPTQNDID